MSVSKNIIEFQRALYQRTRIENESIEYYEIESSSPNLETGEQSNVIQRGSSRFVLTAATLSEFDDLGRISVETADQFFLYLNRDVNFSAKLDAYVKWNGAFWKIIKVQSIHGGTLLACKTWQELVVNE